MKERPILFSGPMVRAILDGRKTQTRRVIKPQPTREHLWYGCEDGMQFWTDDPHQGEKGNPEARTAPYGLPGDRLWVRETWATDSLYNTLKPSLLPEALPPGYVFYRADYRDKAPEYEWRPSIFMPRWVSRINLEIVNIRAERLQEITEADVLAEGIERTAEDWYWLAPLAGVPDYPWSDAPKAYAALWNSINGKTFPWDSNPWVWVVEFKQLKEQS